jgi:hypothetical protein
MATLIRTGNGRWFTSSFFFMVALATLFFALANPGSRIAVAQGAGRTPVYTTGSFIFGQTKQLLPNPALPLTFEDAEPEIRVDVFGNIYVTAIEAAPLGTDLWKSTDKGANFVFLGQPDGAQCPTGMNCTNDAGLGGGDDSIDVSTGGYLYVSSLWLGSTTMSVSYDGGVGGVAPGQKWEVNPVSSAVPADDRQWVAAYGPQTVYMSYRQVLPAGANASNVIFVAKSTDAGKTFPTQVATFPATSEVTARREGNLVVDQYTGNLYTTFRPQELNGHTRAEMWFLKSTDGGATWGLSKIYQGPAGTDIGNIFPVLAVDRGGNLHLAFSQCDYNSASQNSSNCQVMLMSSGDQGATWLDPVRVNNGPGTSYAIFPWMVAGSPGVVDITWYGADINNSTQSANWHMYFAQTTNAMSSSPVFSQVQAVPQVVHNQDICLKGGACGSSGNRDLLEYYSMALDPEGNANIAFADDFNNSPSGLARTWFTKQTGGPNAYAPPAGPAPSTFAANIPVGSPGGEPGMKVDSHNCMFITTPGHPWVWKSENNGLSFLPPVNPVAGRARTAGDEDILPIPRANGARPDLLYFADLGGLVLINIAESTDGGANWFAPGPGGAAGQLDVSSDRQWISYDRGVPAAGDLTVYEMDHEAAAEAIRFSALTNDGVWSPPASGITAPEMLLPPDNTFPNTNPGPVFVDPATHKVYGIFTASTIRTNEANPPFGKLPNVWEAVGDAPASAGLPPGTFNPNPPPGHYGMINYPVFKGVQDSPSALPSPAPTPDPRAQTFGNNTANDFPAAAIDVAGNIYVSWAMNNSRTNEYMVWMATSHDHGQSFYGPFQVSHGPGAAVMPWVGAGDAGRVEIVYYATTSPVDPNIADNTVEWNTMFAQSFNAADREPVFTISPVSHHVMHTGPICNQGILCGTGTRTLADFFQVAIGPDGLANIAYADNGPFPLPSGNPDTSQSGTHAEFARQASGPIALTNPTFPTCLPIPPLSGVVSRKTHGGLTPPPVGPGDLALDLNPSNPAMIEPRSGGSPSGNHLLVFTFVNTLNATTPVTSITATATTSSGTVNVTNSGSLGGDTHQYLVSLTGVPNACHLAVTLHGVTDTAGNSGDIAPVRMDVLWGDVNSSKRTDNGDAIVIRNLSGTIPSASDVTSVRADVNISGRVDNGDAIVVRNNSGAVLPP